MVGPQVGIPAEYLPNLDATLTAAKAARAELDTLISSLEAKKDLSSLANRARVQASFQHLKHEMDGPMTTYLDYVMSIMDYASMQAASRLRIFDAIGADGTATIPEIAEKVKISEEYVQRILKAVSTMYLVKEVEEGKWKLQGAGRLFVDPKYEGAGKQICGEWGHAPTYIARYIERYPDPTKTRENVYTMTDGKTVWQCLSESPEQALSFSSAMLALQLADYAAPVAATLFDATDRSNARGRFIDVGGGSGHVCRYLAPRFPEWSYEVQDIDPRQWEVALAEIKAEAPELEGRIEFKQQSFFEPLTPEPVSEGEKKPVVYFMSQILHDWHDEDAKKIIGNILPCLLADKENRSILLADILLWDFGEVDPIEERDARRYDMTMLTYNGAKERSRAEWRELFKSVDPKFEMVEVRRHQTSGSSMAVLEFKLVE